MPAHDRHPRARLAALLLAAAALTVTTEGGVTAGPAAGQAAGQVTGHAAGVTTVASSGPRRWSGYRIARTGRAAGGWIGGYRVGRTELYLTTPTRRPNRAGFGRTGPVADLAGRTASRRDTARAAWVLSKYGGYRDATQAAAVDATVYHLLVGGPWEVGGRQGKRRVRQSGDPASVARFARFMLRQSRLSAGAYAARLDTSGSDVGGTVAVTLSVTDGHGRPAAGLPVTLRMAGSEPRTAVTGDDGKAVGRFAADARGWQDVTAEVRNVPEHRLHLWRPRKGRQAAAAEGGTTRTLVVSSTTAVRGPQALTLTPAPATAVVGNPVAVAVTAQGDSAAKGVTAALHGPFASASAAACTGGPVGRVSGTLPDEGPHTLPAVQPSTGGYYAWQVDVAASDTSIPASACGAVVKVRARPSASVAAPASASPGNVTVAVTVAGVPFAMKVDLVLKVYAYSGTPTCTGAIAQVPLSRLGDGQVFSGPVWLDAGTYAWRVEAAPGDLWVGAESTCGAPGSTTTVG